MSKRLDVLVVLLSEFAELENRDRVMDALAILLMLYLNFVFCLLLFTDLLQEIKAASDMFQKVAADVSVACDVVDTLMASMKDRRNEEKYHDFVLSALDPANRLDLDCNILTRKRKGCINSALKFFVVTEAIGIDESSSETIECFLRIEIIFSCT